MRPELTCLSNAGLIVQLLACPRDMCYIYNMTMSLNALSVLSSSLVLALYLSLAIIGGILGVAVVFFIGRKTVSGSSREDMDIRGQHLIETEFLILMKVYVLL